MMLKIKKELKTIENLAKILKERSRVQKQTNMNSLKCRFQIQNFNDKNIAKSAHNSNIKFLAGWN